MKKKSYALWAFVFLFSLFSLSCDPSVEEKGDCIPGVDCEDNAFIEVNLKTQLIRCINDPQCLREMPFDPSIIFKDAPSLIRQTSEGEQHYHSNFEELDPLHAALDFYAFFQDPSRGRVRAIEDIIVQCAEPPPGGEGDSGRIAEVPIAPLPEFYPNSIFFAKGWGFKPFQPVNEAQVEFISLSFYRMNFEETQDIYLTQLKRQLGNAQITVLENAESVQLAPDEVLFANREVFPDVEAFTVRSPVLDHRMTVVRTEDPDVVLRINMRDSPNADNILQQYVQLVH